MKTLRIFLIAGEVSGDIIGSRLMMALRQLASPTEIEFHGVGGQFMEEQGIRSLFPMQELAIVGFTELIPHIPHLLGRINQTVKQIEELQPDIVVTIDAPGFNFRVVKKLQGSGIKLIHYVAPSVWAYKPQRAEKIAGLYDHLLMLLPFEAPYFEKVGLPCTFVGHPILEQDVRGGNGNEFRKRHNIPGNAHLLCVMPGSREGELERLLPVFGETVSLLHHEIPDLHAIVLSTDDFVYKVQDAIEHWRTPTKIVMGSGKEKRNALAASTAALVKSGTGTLELAQAGVPMVVGYKVNPISAWMLRRMIQVPYVNLVNLILDEPAIPELLQERCVPELLAAELKHLMNSDLIKLNQLMKVNEALSKLRQGESPTPSEKAAEVVLDLVKD